MVNRSRTAFLSGTITDNPLAVGGTTMNSAGLASLPAIAAPNIAVLVLDPTGSAGAPEVIYVTAHTGAATSATISRGRESSSAREHASGIAWVHGPTVKDTEEHFIRSAHRSVMDLAFESHYGIFAPHGALIGSTLGTIINTGFGWMLNSSGAAGERYDSQSANGAVKLTTGASSGNNAILYGTYLDIADDPVLAAKIDFASAGANADYFVGFTGSQDPTDGNNRYGFRVVGTGNLIGFTDNGGTETTRDYGAAPTPGTFYKLEIFALEGGTILQFFVDGTQVGANVTTNLYTAARLQPFIGVETGTAAAKTIVISKAVYYDNPN